jgi:hypothetical protein
MKKSFVFALALCAAGASLAGSKFTGNGNVVIGKNADGSGAVTGMLGAIYNGPLMKQYIGCQRDESDNVLCLALDEAETWVSCSVKSAFLAQSIASFSPDARVSIQWNAQGKCTRIQVVHSSEYQDKQG